MFESVKHRATKWDFTVFEHNYQEVEDAIKVALDYEIQIHVRINGRNFSKISEKHLILRPAFVASSINNLEFSSEMITVLFDNASH